MLTEDLLILTFGIWISDGPGLLTGRPSDFQIMSSGGECFAPQPLLLEDQTPENHQKSMILKMNQDMIGPRGVKSDQGSCLSARNFIKLDFKKSKFSIILKLYQDCCGSPSSALEFRTWGEYKWNLRRKELG